jgi:Heparan-alpha-glucosaminide N-acetyltransferase, catalytic
MPPPPAQRASNSPPVRWPELDLLRSLAAAMMVINHVAVRAVGTTDDWKISAFAFIGSFAPVFFFFLTGLGSGVQSVGRPASRGHGYILKVLVLFAADAMLWVSPGRFVGLDFFGFIGLSMLCLEWLRRVGRSGLLAATLTALIFTARFLVGSHFTHLLATPGTHWLGAVLGKTGVPGVSYPLCPWLAYPFMGYTLGRLAGWRSDPASVSRPAIQALLGAVAGVTLGATVLLVAKGFVLFRWGTMSLAYFMASLTALAASLALVLGAGSSRALRPFLGWFGVSGVRSFAVVPLHYALIVACENMFGEVVDFGSYAWNATVVLVLSFAGSTLIPKAAIALNSPTRTQTAWAVVSASFVVAFLLLVNDKLGGISGTTVRTITQLGLCILLGTNQRAFNKQTAGKETRNSV